MTERVRATSQTHPDHVKLSETDRLHMSILAHMKLWPGHAIAAAFKVDRKTVYNAMKRYPLIIRGT